MTLEELYYVSQIVAVVAIFCSLIFVGVQVRQNSEQIKANTRSIKASAAFEGTHSWATTNEQVMGMSDDMVRLAGEAYDPGKAWDDFPVIDRTRLALSHRAIFQKLEGLYFLHKFGSLDTGIWESRLRWAAGCIKLPFWRHWWEYEKAQSLLSAEFVAVIEKARDATHVVPWDMSALHGATTSPSQANPQSEPPKP